ncbi:MAG: hypothetical protein E6Y12_10525 [Dermabacter sp.]|nr:hypothetical protein [Dermabacter sp.]
MAANTVKAVIAHNQQLDGKDYEAGDKVDVPSADVKRLVRAGRIQLANSDEHEKIAQGTATPTDTTPKTRKAAAK